MTEYSGFHEAQIKHLDMLQAVIGRLGTNGFIVKGWAITVSGAFFGFAVSEREPCLALASLIPTVLFWFLDTYFLRAERLFRCLFDQVRTGQTSEPFFMEATSDAFVASLGESGRQRASFPATAWRSTLRSLYGGLVATAVALAFIVNGLDDPSARPP